MSHSANVPRAMVFNYDNLTEPLVVLETQFVFDRRVEYVEAAGAAWDLKRLKKDIIRLLWRDNRQFDMKWRTDIWGVFMHPQNPKTVVAWVICQLPTLQAWTSFVSEIEKSEVFILFQASKFEPNPHGFGIVEKRAGLPPAVEDKDVIEPPPGVTGPKKGKRKRNKKEQMEQENEVPIPIARTEDTGEGPSKRPKLNKGKGKSKETGEPESVEKSATALAKGMGHVRRYVDVGTQTDDAPAGSE